MDEQQISQLQEHYSAMSDEELADLLVTRGASLTEEANFALKIIFKKRNIDNIENEFTEKLDFYIAEHELAVQQEHKVKKEKKELRKLAQKFCLLGVFAGVVIMIFDNFDAGLKFGGIMVLGYIFAEWELMKHYFYTSIFRSKK